MPFLRLPLLIAVGLLVASCAAESKRGAAAPEAPGYAGEPAPSAAAPPPPPASPPSRAVESETAPSTSTPTAPSGGYAPAPNRGVAMAQAANDIDASQRELDVAGGDCRNACRALGSMDRAAGRLCTLAQSPDESRRCESAKGRVYSARDKVRNTCGSCPDTSVDRQAPVPSH
jgi:hypothetical protein